MTNAVTTYQNKAVDLRGFLNNGKIKEQLAMALPKWLSPDRLLKVVFSATLRNPKLLECTKESILQSVMMCAQLGLEPVLGRAYLIPYKNSKQIDGKWKKVMECQMQPGYQGLVDLARRSGVIEDVYGHVVYENDEFDIDFGTDRHINHKPCLSGDPGKPIGAYVVWVLKGGLRHPEFMPLHEIHKRRAKSQSYTWAETGNPKNGGGKKDSVWHMWPEDMMIKTVIKHSSKLVPASIDFMEAVAIDDAAEIGKPLISPFSDAPQLPEPRPEDMVIEFWSAVEQRGFDMEQFSKWFENVAKANGKTTDAAAVKVVRENDFEGLFNAFRNQSADKPAPKEPEKPAWHPDHWRGKRGGTPKMGTGLKPYIEANQEAFAKAWPGIDDDIKAELINKYQRFYREDLPWIQPGPENPTTEDPPSQDSSGSNEGSATDAELQEMNEKMERFNVVFTSQRGTPAWHYAQGELTGDENSEKRPEAQPDIIAWLGKYDEHIASQG